MSVNLTDADDDELELFWRAVVNDPIKKARELFPERPRRFVRATEAMAVYAQEKLNARSLHAEGHIERAQACERRCDEIYNELPKYARW